MGNTQKKGGAQPGVIRSDDYPWGLKNINMPIPLDFARRLRNNTDGLQDDYRKFIVNRVYQMIPTFINKNVDTVYNKFRSTNGNMINLVLWNAESNQKGIGNGDIIGLLTPKDEYDRLYDIHCFKRLFYAPNILASLDDRDKAEIIQQIHFPCRFTDDVYIATIILSESISKNSLFNASAALNAYDQKDYELFEELLEEQNTEAGFPDDISNVDLTTLQGQALYDLHISYNQSLQRRVNNRRVLSNLIHGRNVINVGYSLYNPYQQGAHAVSVIIDTVKKVMYILDSNGVGEKAQMLFYYFKQQLNWKYAEYQMIPIMPYKPDETPRSFQGISRGGFCQTWNIFNQELVLLNDVGADINKTIYDEILSHVDPIIGDVTGMSVQVKITLILLEFMFYIFQSCKYEFLSWLKEMDDVDVAYESYKATSTFQEKYRDRVHAALTKISNDFNLIPPELIDLIEKQTEEYLKFELLHGLTIQRSAMMDLDYRINPDTSEYISKFYPEYESSKNLSTDHFINNALHTFL